MKISDEKHAQWVQFLVVVGMFIILFGNIVEMVWHANLPITGLSVKLSKFPPLPEITHIIIVHA